MGELIRNRENGENAKYELCGRIRPLLGAYKNKSGEGGSQILKRKNPAATPRMPPSVTDY